MKANQKNQKLLAMIREATMDLLTAVADAEKASKEFSNDIHARRSFECGYLGSRIKYTLQVLEEAEKLLIK